MRIKHALLVLICLTSITVLNSESIAKDSKESSDLAWHLFEQQKYDDCYNAAIKAISMDANNYYGYYWAGMALSEKGKFKDAESYLQNACQINKNVDNLLGLAICEINLGNSEKGIELLKEINTRDPKNLNALNWIGRTYLFKLKDNSEAIEYLEKYRNLEKNPWMLLYLGIAYSRNSQFDLAMDRLLEANGVIKENGIKDNWIIDNVNQAIDKTKDHVKLIF